MRAVIVDDEPIMIRSFLRYTKNIEELEIVGQFTDSIDAFAFICENPVDVAFLDIEMPVMNGLELAKRLRAKKPELLMVFITAYENYIKESNEIGVDYYVIKPYTEEILRSVTEKLRKMLPETREKSIYIRTFGRFTIFKDGAPIALVGKTKEIMALIVSRRGREISNEELYTTVWEDREYDNIHMKVYYNALKRLRDVLEKSGISELLISTTRGQILNTEICDCDYFAWLAGSQEERDRFEGEFMSEYSWGEELLADLIEMRNAGK